METRKLKKTNTALIVAVSIISALLALFIVMYSMSMSKQNRLKIDLENIYQRNFNELVDNVNNSEIKLSKVTVSNTNSYSKKMLNEISKNTAQASANLSALPVSINGIDETIKFINQVSGYCESLANKLDKGEDLTQQETQTLSNLQGAFKDLKDNINKLSKDIYNGNIYKDSAKLDGDYNNFTLKLQNVKAGDVEYPTMIYDGPFSDSTLNKKIKNLNFNSTSKEDAKQNLEEIFKNVSNSSIEYLGETNGKFQTYDFKLTTSNENAMYVQVTKNGAKLLTLSTSDPSDEKNYSVAQAQEIAINFAKLAGVQNVKCVWSDVGGGDAYFNLAPVQNNIILYPDLLKVKVDLATGNVIGYEASSYFTNHTNRNLPSAFVSQSQAEAQLPTSLTQKETRLCLAPLDYQREVVCYEMICQKQNDTYYVYVNAQTGELENILKTIETDNGNLLL